MLYNCIYSIIIVNNVNNLSIFQWESSYKQQFWLRIVCGQIGIISMTSSETTLFSQHVQSSSTSLGPRFEQPSIQTAITNGNVKTTLQHNNMDLLSDNNRIPTCQYGLSTI